MEIVVKLYMASTTKYHMMKVLEKMGLPRLKDSVHDFIPFQPEGNTTCTPCKLTDNLSNHGFNIVHAHSAFSML